MNTNKNECFIIGSGSSLLNLTAEEIDYINSHPNTLGMNKFLIFHELINLIPKAMFLGDFHFPAQKVFIETIEIAKKVNSEIKYYVDNKFYYLFKEPHLHPVWNLKLRLSTLIRYGYFIPLTTNYNNFDFFKADIRSPRNFFWASNFNENLFFHRGSLTTAINLANIIYPNCNIKLLGVDLSNPYYFYDKDLLKRKDLIDPITHDESRKRGLHYPVIKSKGGTILDFFPKILKELSNQGVNLYCCNPESLLVEKSICDFKLVI